jgi:hypothetical protein
MTGRRVSISRLKALQTKPGSVLDLFLEGRKSGCFLESLGFPKLENKGKRESDG